MLSIAGKSFALPMIALGMIAGFQSSVYGAPAESAPSAKTAPGAYRPREGNFQLLESTAADKDHIAFEWDLDDGADWFKPYREAAPAYQDFTKWVRAHVSPDSRGLLRKNRAFWKRKGWSTKRYDLILGGKLGNIRPINRLEAAVLLIQLDRFGKPYEGEIAAFVLRKAGELRVYGYATGGQTIRPGILRRRLKEDLADHWEYYANLHNHPFIFSREDTTTGELFPSGDASDGDVQYYLADAENFKLQRAWITNGFNTLEVPDKEFPLLGSTPGK